MNKAGWQAAENPPLATPMEATMRCQPHHLNYGKASTQSSAVRWIVILSEAKHVLSEAEGNLVVGKLRFFTPFRMTFASISDVTEY
jgi:hypothetical protein